VSEQVSLTKAVVFIPYSISDCHKQLLPGHCRYHAAVCWWYWGDRGFGLAQGLSVKMGFSACSGPHSNLWSPAEHGSQGKDIAFTPQSKRANMSMRKTIVQHTGQHTPLISCHWGCLGLPVRISSYLKCLIDGVRPPI